MARLRVVLAGLIIGGSSTLLAAPGAHALSCVDPEHVLQDADRIFTGTVIAVEGQDATVRVVDSTGPTRVSGEVGVHLTLEEWWSPGESPRDAGELWSFALMPDSADISPCNAWPGDLPGAAQGAEPEPDQLVPAAPPTRQALPTAGATVVPMGEASAIPDESWNADTNPDMAAIRAEHAEAQSVAAAPEHDATTLTLWALAGVALGAAVLGVLRARRRLG